MEILYVSSRADQEEPKGWAMRFILLRLLLYPEEGSQVAGTTGASEFNLFFEPYVRGQCPREIRPETQRP